MVVVAVVGLPGAGKTVATERFLKAGFSNVYFGQPTFDLLKEKGMEVNEKNERWSREHLRKAHGMHAMAKLLHPKVKELVKNGPVVLESFYSWEEYTFMKEKFGDDFKVLAIVTNPEERYKRMAVRKERGLTPEQTKSRDHSQIENLNQAGPIAMANWTIINEGPIEEVQQQVDKVIEEIKSDKSNNI